VPVKPGVKGADDLIGGPSGTQTPLVTGGGHREPPLPVLNLDRSPVPSSTRDGRQFEAGLRATELDASEPVREDLPEPLGLRDRDLVRVVKRTGRPCVETVEAAAERLAVGVDRAAAGAARVWDRLRLEVLAQLVE
jgi:hypothetical protein